MTDTPSAALKSAADSPAAPQPQPAPGFDDAGFDDLVTGLSRWSGALPDWPPARRVRAEWEEVAPRLDRARRELARVLVVGVIHASVAIDVEFFRRVVGASITIRIEF
jgi:hypothetical protein